MTEKRYYTVDYDEQYYIFDSNVIRKGRVEEEAEYSYDVFANSMSSTEIIDKLNELTNENEQLKLRNKQYSMMVNANSDLNDEIYEQLQKTEKALKRVCEENEQLKNKCENYKQALLDLGINVNILDGTGDD